MDLSNHPLEDESHTSRREHTLRKDHSTQALDGDVHISHTNSIGPGRKLTQTIKNQSTRPSKDGNHIRPDRDRSLSALDDDVNHFLKKSTSNGRSRTKRSRSPSVHEIADNDDTTRIESTYFKADHIEPGNDLSKHTIKAEDTPRTSSNRSKHGHSKTKSNQVLRVPEKDDHIAPPNPARAKSSHTKPRKVPLKHALHEESKNTPVVDDSSEDEDMVEIRMQAPSKRVLDNYEEESTCGKRRRLSYQSESDGQDARVQQNYQRELFRARVEANPKNFQEASYGGKRRRTSREALTDNVEVKFLKRKSDGEESDEEMQKKKSKLGVSRPDGSSQDELSRGSTRRKSRAASLRNQSPLRVSKGPSKTRGGRGYRSTFQTAEYQRVQNTVDSNGYSASQFRGLQGEQATQIPDSQNSDVQYVSTGKVEQPGKASTNAFEGPKFGSLFDEDEATVPSSDPRRAASAAPPTTPRTGPRGPKASAAQSVLGDVPQYHSDSEDELAQISPATLLVEAKHHVNFRENLKDRIKRMGASTHRADAAREEVRENGVVGVEATRDKAHAIGDEARAAREEVTSNETTREKTGGNEITTDEEATRDETTEAAHKEHGHDDFSDDERNEVPIPEVICPLVKIDGIRYEFPVFVVICNREVFEQTDLVLILDCDQALIQLSEELFGVETIVSISKIRKILCHETRATRYWVRLETSLSGNGDTKIDIQFRSFEHYVPFILQLRNLTNLDATDKSPKFLETAALRRSMMLKGRIPRHLSPMPESPCEESAGPGANNVATTTSDLGGDRRSQAHEPDTCQGQDDGQEAAQTKIYTRAQLAAALELDRRHSGIDDILESVGAPRQTRSRAPQEKHDEAETKEKHSEAETKEADRYSVSHGLGTPWKHPLVYPRTGKKKVTVDFDDLERLDEGQLLNDNLVEFAIRYIKEQHPESTKNVYQFNTFFYSTLTKAKRGHRINHDAVKMWTRNVDIFAHDFVVVPINESYHWYVAIICNLPALQRKMPKWGYNIGIQEGDSALAQDLEDALTPDDDITVDQARLDAGNGQTDATNMGAAGARADETESWNSLTGDTTTPFNIHEDDEADARDEDGKAAGAAALPKGDDEDGLGELFAASPGSSRKKARRAGGPRLDPDAPAIITLDSLGGTHPQTIRALKDYLVAEARAKRGGMELDAGRVRGMTAKGIPLQQNFSDCGLYLLGYAEKFAEDPRAFARRMLRREFDAEADWPHLDPSDMRAQLRRRLVGLHEVQEADRKGARKAKKGKKAAAVPVGSAANGGGEDVGVGGGAVRGQPELEVPRTPEPEVGSERRAGRAGAPAAAALAEGRILVPDSQEGSAYDQLASAAAGVEGSGVGHPQSPARPPTRGKAAAAAEREVEVVELED